MSRVVSELKMGHYSPILIGEICLYLWLANYEAM